jgi:hypothetical protein
MSGEAEPAAGIDEAGGSASGRARSAMWGGVARKP